MINVIYSGPSRAWMRMHVVGVALLIDIRPGTQNPRQWERRRGRFDTEAAARAWIEQRKGAVAPPPILTGGLHPGAPSPV